jgi:hypothetical protein
MNTSLYLTENLYAQKFQTLLYTFLKRKTSLLIKGIGFSLFLLLGSTNLLLAGTGVIGDKVWNDANENGAQNAGEAGIPDINVDLEIYDGPASPSASDLGDPNNWTILASMTTNSIGSYNFTGLEAAYYRLKFGLKAGYKFTGKNQTTFFNDSDAGVDGYTDAFFIAEGLTDNTHDAGMYADTQLPVKLASFVVSKGENNSAILSWTTTEEVNSDYFSIEQSADARSWVELAKVLSNGNQTGLAKYQYKDQLPQNGSNYYRLKMVDTDGSFAYSNIKEISIESGAASASVVSYPNPTSDQLFLKTTAQNTIVGAKIFNLSGKTVLVAKPSQIATGINVQGLSEGIYVVNVTLGNGKTENQKVLVVR